MVNFNQLRVFYNVAQYNNCSLAAKKLFITQPAVTAQIKHFEDECELLLFKRMGNKLFLTEEGKIIYEHARQIFKLEQELNNLINDIKMLRKGRLRIGTARTYARYVFPMLVSHFHKDYPDIQVVLDEGSSHELINSLYDLRNEIAIISKTVVKNIDDIQIIPIFYEDLKLIVGPNHHLNSKKQISIEELKQEPIIMKEKGSGTRNVVDEVFKKYNIKPNILMEVSDAEVIKLLVQNDEAISFLVNQAVSDELQQKKTVLCSN